MDIDPDEAGPKPVALRFKSTAKTKKRLKVMAQETEIPQSTLARRALRNMLEAYESPGLETRLGVHDAIRSAEQAPGPMTITTRFRSTARAKERLRAMADGVKASESLLARVAVESLIDAHEKRMGRSR